MVNMRVLITGGAGYLGSALIKQLIHNDNISEIIVVDKLVYGTGHLASIICDKINIIVADIQDFSRYQAELSKADIIIHLASLVGSPLVNRKPIDAYNVNVTGTLDLIQRLSKNQKLIFASTGSCYGPVDGVCDESLEISPSSSYGEHKALGEDAVLAHDGYCLRFSTVFGLSPKMRNDLYIHTMLQRAIIDGSVVMYQGGALRSFININDAARAVEHLSLATNLEDRIFNVGDPKMSLTKRQICDHINNLKSFTVVENDYTQDFDNRDYTVNFDRLTKTGFECLSKFEAEIQNLYDYYNCRFVAGYENG